MNVTRPNSFTSSLIDQLAVQRGQLNDLSLQLTSGLKAQTFGGLGSERALALSFQSKLDTASTFQNTITLVDTRMNIMNTSVQRLSDIGTTIKAQFTQQSFNMLNTGLTQQQQGSSNGLDEMVSLFNSDVGGRYVFGGKQTDKQPVTDINTIMNGTGTQAGLKQVINERYQADLGDGLGRVTLGAAAGVASITEDGTHPFGLKLGQVTSSLTGATVTQPTGAPKAETVDFTSGLPTAGDTIKFDFTLPDGTTKSVVLTAATTATSTTAGAADQATTANFQIGVDAATTAVNLKAALTVALTSVGKTDLKAASAFQAGDNFFNTYQGQAPQRVSGPPFATATALTNGTATNTVSWYTGDQSATNPRLDATAQVDTAISINYGMRANEPAFRWQLQQLAVASAFDVSGATANDKAAYTALSNRMMTNLSNGSTQPKISSIQTEIAGSYVAVKQAQVRHTTEVGTYQQAVEKFVGADQTTVIASLSALQTQMQASYQASSILFKMSLSSYL